MIAIKIFNYVMNNILMYIHVIPFTLIKFVMVTFLIRYLLTGLSMMNFEDIFCNGCTATLITCITLILIMYLFLMPVEVTFCTTSIFALATFVVPTLTWTGSLCVLRLLFVAVWNKRGRDHLQHICRWHTVKFLEAVSVLVAGAHPESNQ